MYPQFTGKKEPRRQPQAYAPAHQGTLGTRLRSAHIVETGRETTGTSEGLPPPSCCSGQPAICLFCQHILVFPRDGLDRGEAWAQSCCCVLFFPHSNYVLVFWGLINLFMTEGVTKPCVTHAHQLNTLQVSEFVHCHILVAIMYSLRPGVSPHLKEARGKGVRCCGAH